MRRNFYNSEAIILSSKNYSEADKIIVLYSKNYGKISVIAKGIKRIKSRKRGSTETFNLVHFQAIETNGMPIVTELEIINTFEGIKQNLKFTSVAYYLCEITSKLTQERQENVALFTLLKQYLAGLAKTSGLKVYRQKFAQQALVILGFLPDKMIHNNIDNLVEEIVEKKLTTIRIGKRLTI